MVASESEPLLLCRFGTRMSAIARSCVLRQAAFDQPPGQQAPSDRFDAADIQNGSLLSGRPRDRGACSVESEISVAMRQVSRRKSC